MASRVAPAAAAAAAVFVASVASVGVVERRQAVQAADGPAAVLTQAAAVDDAPAAPTGAGQSVAAGASGSTARTRAPMASSLPRSLRRAPASPTTTTTTVAPSTTTTTTATTTTTTTTLPPSQRDDDNPVEELVAELPVALPDRPLVDELSELPDEELPLLEGLPLDAFVEMDAATLLLVLFGSDEPLASPAAPGLPV